MAQDATLDKVSQLAALIQQHIPHAVKEVIAEEERAQSADAASVERFALPFQDYSAFGSLFMALEAQGDSLHIQDFSVAMTSLEEVFMALGKQATR